MAELDLKLAKLLLVILALHLAVVACCLFRSHELIHFVKVA
jgi:cytochrome b